MPEPLKHIYSKAFLTAFANVLSDILPGFNKKKFLSDIMNKEWAHKELKARMKHIASVLQTFLTSDYKKDITTVLKVIEALEERGIEDGGLHYMFFPEYIELFGQDHHDISMKAIERVTQFTSCEFAIRPFIIRHPEKTMQQMLKWSAHKSHLVRRFSSEGCRPRLPWAMAIPALKKDPAPIFPILENLKNDSSEFVRRSVANNLNDIAKDNPDSVVKLAQRWIGTSKETDWILKHGSRTLLKKAHVEVLQLFGWSDKVECVVTNFRINAPGYNIGDAMDFSFDLKSTAPESVKLRLEFAVYYMKSNGKWNRKLFKITENQYENHLVYAFKRKLSFRNLTTRKHYIGKHKIAIVVNGNELAIKEFKLTNG